MTKLNKNLPPVKARDFVQGNEKPASTKSTNIAPLKENPDVLVLDAKDASYLSSTVDRVGEWCQRGMSGPILSMEKWQGKLKEMRLSCGVDPNNCGLYENITINLFDLAKFYNQAIKSRQKLTSSELQLRKDLEGAGYLAKNGKGEFEAKGASYIIALSRTPSLNVEARAELFKNAYAKLLPYIDSEVGAMLSNEWNSLTPAEQSFLQSMFATSGYFDPKNIEGMQTAVGAYSYLAPDQRMGLTSIYLYAEQKCAHLESIQNRTCLEYLGRKSDIPNIFELFWELHRSIAPKLQSKIPDVD